MIEGLAFLRPIRVAPGEDAAAWAGALQGAWLRGAQTLKNEPAGAGRSSLAWVRRARLLGQDVVVKCRGAGGLAERMKSVARRGRFERHWRGAERLAAVGVATARPLLLASGEQGGRRVEVLVMEALAGRTLLAHLAERDLSPGQERAVARALGLLLARLWLAGVFNRDSKPSNLLVTSAGAPLDGDGAGLAVLDCVGLRPGPRAGFSAPLFAMLASILREPLGCGLRLGAAERQRVVRAMLDEVWQREPGPDGAEMDLKNRWTHATSEAIWSRVTQLLVRRPPQRPRVHPLEHGGSGRLSP